MSVDLLLSTEPIKEIGLQARAVQLAGIQRTLIKPKLRKDEALLDKVIQYAGKQTIQQVRDECTALELYTAWDKGIRGKFAFKRASDL
jgi:hypothetical protein